MNDISNGNPVIFIDQKKFRIRIHRNTLHMLGDPAFIQLLVNPESRTLAIRPAAGADTLAHRVLWKKLGDKQSCELHSSHLIHKLQSICAGWKYGTSYRLFGEMLHSENIVLFDLQRSLPANDQEAGSE
jgi:hypothetical protein